MYLRNDMCTNVDGMAPSESPSIMACFSCTLRVTFYVRGGIEFYCRNTIHQNELLPATGCSYLINEIFGPSGEMALHDTYQKAIKERGVHIYTISRIFFAPNSFSTTFSQIKKQFRYCT